MNVSLDEMMYTSAEARIKSQALTAGMGAGILELTSLFSPWFCTRISKYSYYSLLKYDFLIRRFAEVAGKSVRMAKILTETLSAPRQTEGIMWSSQCLF